MLFALHDDVRMYIHKYTYVYVYIIYQLKSTFFRAKKAKNLCMRKHVNSKQGDIVLAIHLGCPPELRQFGCGNGTKVHLIFLNWLSERLKNKCVAIEGDI